MTRVNFWFFGQSEADLSKTSDPIGLRPRERAARVTWAVSLTKAVIGGFQSRAHVNVEDVAGADCIGSRVTWESG